MGKMQPSPARAFLWKGETSEQDLVVKRPQKGWKSRGPPHLPALILAVRSLSSRSRLSRVVSHSSTLCRAGVSSPATSCSTCRMLMCEGMRRLWLAIIFSSVVFPSPFLPTSP